MTAAYEDAIGGVEDFVVGPFAIPSLLAESGVFMMEHFESS